MRPSVPTPLLKVRSDEQLVAQFRRGNEDAFRVIHDRYRARLFAYTRQMLPGSRHDAEDALQEVFVRAHRALRESDRDVSLRAWLYRVAHNRCVDELRRPLPPPPEVLERLQAPSSDPLAEAERRDDLRRLVTDIRRLPDHQRSALLMRELDGLSYGEVAAALGVTVPAVKSLLVRARMGLAEAGDARDAACAEIRETFAAAHEGGRRADPRARRHARDCSGCAGYRAELRGASRKLGALAPALAPAAALARLFTAGSGSVAAGGSAALGGSGAATGTIAIATTKVVAVVCVAVVTAGGAVEVSRTMSRPAPARHHVHRAAGERPASPVRARPAALPSRAARAVRRGTSGTVHYRWAPPRRRWVARRRAAAPAPAAAAEPAVADPAGAAPDQGASTPGEASDGTGSPAPDTSGAGDGPALPATGGGAQATTASPPASVPAGSGAAP